MAIDILPLSLEHQFGLNRQARFGLCLACRTIFRNSKRAVYCSRICYVSLEAKFWRYTKKTETCWIWQGTLDRKGYGLIKGLCDGQYRFLRAHRYAYILHGGVLNDSLTIDHLCKVHGCVNPAHLEAVSRWENTRRGDTITGNNSRKTHCKHGHPFDEANTYLNKNGARQCRACARFQHAKTLLSAKEFANRERRKALAHGNNAAPIEPP